MSQAPVISEEYSQAESEFARNTAELNRQVDEGTSWSGHERNSVFLNIGQPDIPSFADVSAVAGFDFPDDSRALVSLDWDADGDLDVVTANRTSPRVRVFENRFEKNANSWLAVKLVGSEANRDAIGSRLALVLKRDGHETVIERTLHGGQGFLSQSSKWLHFGIPIDSEVVSASVHWNSERDQEIIAGLSKGAFWKVVQGSGRAERVKRTQTQIDGSATEAIKKVPQMLDLAKLERPIPLPALPYTDLSGQAQTLSMSQERPVVLNLWATWCAPCVAELKEFTQHAEIFRDSGFDVLALCVDATDEATRSKATKILQDTEYPFSAGFTTDRTLDLIHLAHNSVFVRPSQLPVPSTLFLGPNLKVHGVARGAMTASDFIPVMQAMNGHWEAFSRLDEGPWVHGPDTVYYVTIAKDMLEKGWRDEASNYLLAHREALAPEGKKYGEVLMLAGTRSLEANDRVGGTRLLQAAVQTQPDLAVARNNLAVALLQSGRRYEAEAQLRAAIAIEPQFADALVNLAQCHLDNDQSTDAQQLLKEVLERGYHPKAMRIQAQLHLRADDDKELHHTFLTIVQHEPKNVTNWVNLAKIQQRLGESQAAYASYQKAASLAPNNTDIRAAMHALRGGVQP